MNRILYFIIFYLFFSYDASSQRLTLFDVDASSFPIMRAKFYAFGSAGQQILDALPSDFQIVENGQIRKIISVNCPPKQNLMSISSVITIDISGSMEFGNIEIAKEAAQAWINGLPAGKYECAITSFDDQNYLNQDFTEDKNLLTKATNSLVAKGGTNFNAALIDPPAGALVIAESGKYKKVVVLLTDGIGTGDYDLIVKKANEIDATIFCVTLRMTCPTILKNISTTTGGMWFENVKTVEEAKEIYNSILQISHGVDPCTIEWESRPACNSYPTQGFAELKTINRISPIYYQQSINHIKSIDFLPLSVQFKNIIVGGIIDTTINLIAKNGDFIVTDLISSNPVFSLEPKSFQLKNGENINLTLSYNAKDSSYQYSKIDFIIDECPTSFYVSGGKAGFRPSDNTLKIVSPNGGELFVAGNDTIIEWEGILPDEKVKLEYSHDNGKNWSLLTKTATDLKYHWKNIPKPASQQCLVKVSQNMTSDKDTNALVLWESINFSPTKSKWSLNGELVALFNSEGRVKIYDINNGEILLKKNTYLNVSDFTWINNVPYLIYHTNDYFGIVHLLSDELVKEIPTPNEIYKNITVSNDLTYIACTLTDGTTKIWDLVNDSLLTKFKVNKVLPVTYEWSPDSDKLAIAYSDNTIRIRDLQLNNFYATFEGHINTIKSLSWNSDGKKLVSVADEYTIKFWDIESKSLYKSISNHSGSLNSVNWSPDDTKIITTSEDKTVKIIDVATGALVNSLSDDITPFIYASCNPNGNKLALSTLSRTFFIWNTETGLKESTYSGHTRQLSSVSISPNQSFLASSSDDKQIKIWNLMNGALINSFNLNQKSYSINWNTDGNLISVAGYDGVRVFDPFNGNEIAYLKEFGKDVQYISLSPDGTKIATRNTYRNVKIWNLSNQQLEFELSNLNATIMYISWSPDGSKICICYNDGNFKVWEMKYGQELHKIWSSYGRITSFAWSPDGKFMLSGTDDGVLSFWDAITGKKIRQIYIKDNAIKLISWSPNNDKIAWLTNNYLRLWDIQSSKIVEQYNGFFYGYVDLAWHQNNIILSCGYSDLLRNYVIENTFLQSDISDSVFQVVVPVVKAQNVDLKECLVGSIKDSIITHFILNESDIPIRIKSIKFMGIDAHAFHIVSGIPEFWIEPQGSYNVEFRFTPFRKGVYSSEMIIFTQSDTLYHNISGLGVEPSISVLNNLIDFGQVNVGMSKDTSQVITIKNVSSTTINISETKHGKPNDMDFSTLAGGGAFQLKPGDTAKMDLRFVAANVGRTSGTLEFHFDGLGSPAVVQLFGEGVDLGPRILAEYNRMSDIICESSSTGSVNLSNAGFNPLIINDITISGADASDFLIEFNPLLSIQKDSTVDLPITFVPKSSGTKNAVLIINSNSVINPELEIPISARKDSISIISLVSNIDFGFVCPNEMKDTIITIKNIGTIIGSAELTCSNIFELSENLIDLIPDEEISVSIRLLAQSVSGEVNGTLKIVDDLCNYEYVINIYANISLPAPNADDITIQTFMGHPKEGIINIRNTGQRDFVINSAPQINSPYEFVGNVFPLEIKAGQSADVVVRFTPISNGEESIILNFETEPCSQVLPVKVSTITGASGATIELPQVSAYAGEIISIPLQLKNVANLSESGVTGFDLTISFNRTLLAPLDYPSYKIDENTAEVRLNNLKPDETGNLGNLRFVAGLGNAEETVLHIVEIKSLGANSNINTIDGTFTMIGLCDEGGTRLFNPYGTAGIKQISPNPTDKDIIVNINLIEKATTKLTVFNSLGIKCDEFIIEGETGEKNVQINTSEYSSGIYYIHLQTPTVNEVKKFVVVK